MPDFYDYDMIALPDGTEMYTLRRNGQPLGKDKICHIHVVSQPERKPYYARYTQWGPQVFRGCDHFDDLDHAMRAGTAWAIERAKEDAR